MIRFGGSQNPVKTLAKNMKTNRNHVKLSNISQDECEHNVSWYLESLKKECENLGYMR